MSLDCLGAQVGADLWLCLPAAVNASDEYHAQLAALVLQRLDTQRRVFLEYGNGGAGWITGHQRLHTVRILDIWEAAWGPDSARLVGVGGCPDSLSCLGRNPRPCPLSPEAVPLRAATACGTYSPHR